MKKIFFGRRQKYASNEKDILCMNRKMRNDARWIKCFPLSPSFVLNRYGLRTNSLMLLGLCLGWIFGILSFHKDKDVVFQLSFGLVNGLQVGIFSNIVYIHKVISRMNSWCNFKRNDVITAGETALSLGFWFLSFRSNTKGHDFDLLEKPLSFMLTWEKKQLTPLVSRRNDVWETGAEIPYWWGITTQNWVTLLIGHTLR